MATSSAEICNLALSLLKTPPITSLDSPKTEVERICALWYDSTREEVLRQHPWNFAKARTTLSLSAVGPDFGYADQYALPIDFIRLRFIGDENEGLGNEDFEIEGGYLLMDNGGGTSLEIGYIKDVENVSLFDSLFLKCFSLSLAVNMAFGLTGKTTVRTDLRNMLIEANTQARAVNGQDKPPVRITRSRVIGARRQFGGMSGVNQADPTRLTF